MFTVITRMGTCAPVKINKPILSLLTLLLVSNSLMAEVPTAPKSNLTHTLGTFEFSLSNEKQNCQIQATNKSEDKGDVKTIPLLLESPCYWIASSETKALLHYSYEAISVDHTLLVAGTPLDWSAEKKAYQKLPEDSYCTQFLQGVILSKEEVFAVNEKMVAAHCETGLAIDEKIFYAIAHNPDRYQEKLPEAAAETTGSTETERNTQATLNAKPEGSEEKSFLDSVTDRIKGLFSDSDKDAK